MPLPEYLFIDKARLQTYAEQISSPVTYDKVPVWKAGISLTGPSAAAEQSRHARPLTVAEQIDRVSSYLKEQRLIMNGRVEAFFDIRDWPFRFESCRARKIFLPPVDPEILVPEPPYSGIDLELGSIAKLGDFQEDLRQRRALTEMDDREAKREKIRRSLEGFHGLTLWYSGVPREHPLYLLQDFGESDNAPALGSAYSALSVLLSQVAGPLRKTVLYSSVEKRDLTNPTSQVLKSFTKDPMATLEQLGARVFEERSIDTLYRVRNLMPQVGGTCTIAYPLYISE